MRRLRLLLPWFILALYWPLIFVGTHVPRPPRVYVVGKDKTLHLGAFMILTLLFWLARNGTLRPHFRRAKVYLILVLMAGYAAIDELTQEFFVPSRQGDLSDWVADMGGVVAAIALLYFLRSWRQWLITYWVVLFIITHFPGRSFFEKVPPFLQQFQVLAIMGAYVALTFLWWRSWCPEKRFMVNKTILLTTIMILPVYALIDELVSVLLQRGFDWGDFYSGLTGIALGVVCSVALAQQHVSDDAVIYTNHE